jgi:hypothetical protein
MAGGRRSLSPRSSSDEEEDEEEEEAAPRVAHGFAALPELALVNIYRRLPVDERVRCGAVCPAWRDALWNETLWARVDLSARTGGVAHTHTKWQLLHRVSTLAEGGMQALDLSGWTRAQSMRVLRDVLRENAELSELRMCDLGDDALRRAEVRDLLDGGSQLTRFEAHVVYESNDDVELLRGEEPFDAAVLRIVQLELRGLMQLGSLRERAEDVARAPSLAWLTQLTLSDCTFSEPAALDAVVDAVLARGISTLVLRDCRFAPHSELALVRALGGAALTTLEVDSELRQTALLRNEHDATLLGDALRTNATLTSLTLKGVGLLQPGKHAAALLNQLHGHASLRELNLSYNECGTDCTDETRATFGQALTGLLSCNAPALAVLDVSQCGLGDAGMARVCDALRDNSHLKTLRCGGNSLTGACLNGQLLDAVRANTSLRCLECDGADAAVALVRSRS